MAQMYNKTMILKVDFCVFKFMYMEFSNLIINKGGHFLHKCQRATCNIVFFFYFSKLDDITSNTHIMTVLFMRVVCLCILSVTVYKCFGVQSRQSKVHKIKRTKGAEFGFLRL